MPHQLLFCTRLCGCPGNLKIAVRPEEVWVRSLAWAFFTFILFFIHFIKLSSAVEMSSSIQNFSPITFFCKIIMFCEFKNRLKISSAKSHQFEILKYCLCWNGFFKISKHWISLTKKKCYGSEILCRARHLNCGWEFDKMNLKKYEGKKPMPRIEPRPLRA
jgi:hypothetical protein